MILYVFLIVLLATRSCVAVNPTKPCPVQKPCICELHRGSRFEVNCRAKDLREVPVFTGNVTVYLLDLRDNPIYRLRDNSFAGIKPTVIHLDQTILSADGIGRYAFQDVTDTLRVLLLDAIPKHALNILSELNYLHITGNTITELPAHAFVGLSRLETLEISGRRLQTVHEKAFVDVGNSLKHLHLTLSINKVNDFPMAINRLVNLETLDLSKSLIAYIPRDAFSMMKRLKSLNLKQNILNRADSFHNDTFKPIEGTLRYLNVASNDLTTLSNEPFRFLRKLRSLDVSGNKLYQSKTSKSEFKYFDSLQKLTMKRMIKLRLTASAFECIGDTLIDIFIEGDLMEIPREALKPLKKLTDLILSNNKLKTLPANAFEGVSATYIRMEANLMSQIDPNAFRGMTNGGYITIDLDHNKIHNVRFLSKTPCMFHSVHLWGNPIDCDCGLLNVTLISDGPIIHGVCHTPQVFAGTVVRQVTEHHNYSEICGEIVRSQNCSSMSYGVNYFVVTACVAHFYLL